MTVLVVADTHFTDRAADEYRWPLFPWLKKQAQEYKVTEVVHCGDLTDAKDHHSGRLVNRLFDEIAGLSEAVKFVLLRGNHDGIDPRTPFFRFLNNNQAVKYVIQPEIVELSIGKATFIPSGITSFKLHEFPYAFAHATFDGSEAENGRLLPGIDPAMLKSYGGKLFSGDIHVPQRLRANIEYVGAPYHIRFGDRFQPRVLLIRDDGTTEDLRFPAPCKHVLSIREAADLDCDIPAGDQVKMRFYLARSEYHQWKIWQEVSREWAEERGWLVAGQELLPLDMAPGQNPVGEAVVTAAAMMPNELIEAYAKKHNVGDDYIKIGKELLS